MFLLGHLGIGSRLGRSYTEPLARPALYLGCVLPDLIDKPLYYALALATGKRGAELGLISSSRTIGHALIFAIVVSLLVRGARGWALFVGICTHYFLDLGGDLWGHALDRLGWSAGEPPRWGPTTLAAVFFPLLGPHFPIMPYRSFAEHAMSLTNSYVVLGELIGGICLYFDWREYKAGKGPMVGYQFPWTRWLRARRAR